jgi:hypothetical protein
MVKLGDAVEVEAMDGKSPMPYKSVATRMTTESAINPAPSLRYEFLFILMPNVSAQAQPLKTGVACNDDVGVS